MAVNHLLEYEFFTNKFYEFFFLCRFAQMLLLIEFNTFNTMYLKPFKRRFLLDKSDSAKRMEKHNLTCKENRLKINIQPCGGMFCFLINGDKRIIHVQNICAPHTSEIMSLCNMYSFSPASYEIKVK